MGAGAGEHVLVAADHPEVEPLVVVQRGLVAEPPVPGIRVGDDVCREGVIGERRLGGRHAVRNLRCPLDSGEA